MTTDTSLLTAWASDSDFNTVFARQIEAIDNAGDILIAISTRGSSINILVASTETQRIQEGHILIGHIIYEAVENHALNSNYYKLTNIQNGAIISIDGT